MTDASPDGEPADPDDLDDFDRQVQARLLSLPSLTSSPATAG